jgi:hypothetical protein
MSAGTRNLSLGAAVVIAAAALIYAVPATTNRVMHDAVTPGVAPALDNLAATLYAGLALAAPIVAAATVLVGDTGHSAMRVWYGTSLTLLAANAAVLTLGASLATWAFVVLVGAAATAIVSR